MRYVAVCSCRNGSLLFQLGSFMRHIFKCRSRVYARMYNTRCTRNAKLHVIGNALGQKGERARR